MGLWWLWYRRRPNYTLGGALFWLGAYVLLRFMLWFAGPGYEFKLHTYGVMIATGFVVGIYLAARQSRREGLAPDVVLDLGFWILVASMVGSRVLFIIVNINQYMADPMALLKFWQGGLVFYGGFIGALLAVSWYCSKYHISFFQVADILVPSVAIGHTFGRLGCFSAGCCHGIPTGIAGYGAIYHAAGTVVARNHLLGVPLHPTQLYEAAGELLIFFVLVMLRKRKRFHGQLLIVYLFLYPILRSVNEMFRGDYERGMLFRWNLFGDSRPELLSISQLISFILAVVAVGMLIALLRKKDKPRALDAAKDSPEAISEEKPV